MPKITVAKESSLQPNEVFDKVSSMLEADSELQKLDPGYKCEFNRDNLSGSAKGRQFSANLSVSEASGGSKVEIIVDLPFHLGLVKGLVQKTLEKKLEKTLT